MKTANLPIQNNSFVANLALPGSEERLRLLEHQKLIQTSLDGFWVASTKDARILEVNDAFCNMVGYSREELLTMRISDLEADESPAETATHCKKVMDAGYDRFETRHRHKLGHLVALEVSASYANENGGEFFVFVRDITERKRTEDALYFIAQRGWMNSAENFFDALAQYLGETLSVDYVIIDRLDKEPGIAETVALYAKGTIVPNFRYDLKGTPCESVMGRKFCFYPQDIQQLFPDDTLLVEMGVESYAGIPLWDSAGQPIGLIAVMDSKPLRDEGAVSKLLQLVAIRATAELERERSDRILREREQEFRSLAESSPDFIVRYDIDGRHLFLNDRLLKLLELAKVEEVIGKRPGEVWTDGRFAELERAAAHAADSGSQVDIEIVQPAENGAFRYHQVFVVPERNMSGQIVGTIAFGREITVIREAERRLKHFIDNLPGMAYTFRLSPNGHACFPFISPSIEQFYGLKPEDVQDDMAPLHRFWHPDDRIHIEAAAAESARTMTPFRIESRVCRPGQPERWLEARALPEREADGSILWHGLMLDITERKQAEEALRISEQQFRTLAENMPDTLIRYDREGRRTYINPALKRISAVRDEQMIGLTQQESNPFHMPETYRLALERAITSGERSEIELQIPTPSGDIRTNLVSIAAERAADGEICGAIVIGRDITQLKQTEALLKERLRQIGELNSDLEESARNLRAQSEELAASQQHLKQTEAWYRSILHSAPDGMVVTDARGVITQVNAQIEAMFGYAAGELVGQPVELLLPPGVRKGHVGKHADFAVATAGNHSKSIEARGLRGYRKDGVEFPVDVSLSRLPDTNEMAGYVCAAIRDITERKRMEQERINHLMRLEEISRSLVATQEDVRQRLACELHDRTSPNLAAIDINLNVIAEEITYGTPTDLTERLEDIRALISDTTASIREIGAEMRPPLLDYAGLVAAMENYALLFARRTGIQVYFECKNADSRYAPQIESLLFRIFQEALTNCSKHSSAESIRISLCNDITPHILTIADDGVGFDLAQLSKTRKIGLGLLNMREMAEIAGVKIAIASTIDKGTCISLEI